MMSNLFSIFDPCTSVKYSLNWISLIYFIMFLPNLYWVSPSKFLMVWNLLISFFIKEMTNSLKNTNMFNMLIFISLFNFILLNNFISLFPYIFNVSSHLSFSLSLSLMMWLSFMLFGWMKNSFIMFIHLTPQGTPYILMPFMVLIETVSNIIRPLTLAIRLSANIIAGHLLMVLISQSSKNLNFSMINLMILIQMILVILEIAVSFIQGYVFSTLSMLYSVETN